MSTWASARRAWRDVELQIEEACLGLRCSTANAWYRGHVHVGWDLTPFIHRRQRDTRLTQRILPNSEFLQADVLAYRLSADQLSAVTRLLRLERDTRAELSRNEKLIRSIRQLMAFIEGHKSHLPPPEEVYETARNGLSVQSLSLEDCSDPQAIRAAIDSDTVKKAYRRRTEAASDARRQLDKLRDEIAHEGAICYGEEEAFNDFSYRCGERTASSWEVLAMMQHYLVPTRLLDWSENLTVALNFAFSDYFQALRQDWISSGDLKEHGFDKMKFTIPTVERPSPAIWVLNPYTLAQKSTRANKIFDVTIDPKLDYYQSFFLRKDWPFDRAIPIYSPWRNPRLAAQQGLFTVHGLNRASLDAQVPDAVRKIEIPPQAAVFGVRMLARLNGFDRFSMFRDLDTLGRDIRDRFDLG